MKILLVWNIIVFLIYGLDKLKSIINGWRISEKMLITSAVMAGGIGAAVGMLVFRHKIRKKRFFAASAAGIAVLSVLFFYC